MFDLAYNPTDALVLAQATTPPALVAPQPNWISKDTPSLKVLTEDIKNPDAFKSVNPYTYTENGPLGMPALVWNKSLDYIRTTEDGGKTMQTSEHALSLSFASCYRLDVEAKQAGAWGPECKITKFITMPKGKLSPPTWTGAGEGDYMYTPPRVGTDTVRFILENGAGKKVDVTVKIKTIKWAPESNVGSDSEFANLEQNNEEFLPTSNPNEWVARPGSAAEGKMDMLTVLLHEYGHALGLDHTADAHDFMAATLLPGVRRPLSTEDQLMLMRLTGYAPVPGSPSDPFSPFLGAPLVFGLGRLA